MPFLPMTKRELQQLGWEYLDVILITGDAYVDHPSFGTAIIGRVLESKGYKVGVIAQPDINNVASFQQLGQPRLFFGITAGNMDSMINHYTAQKKLRHNDAYSPDGISGLRPDRATIIYTNIVKRLFKGVPVVIGGIEASLRRIAHYDYWQDKVRNSILADSKADILIYGMGERPVCNVADAMAAGIKIADIQDVPSTVVFGSTPPKADNDAEVDSLVLPRAELCKDRVTFYKMTQQFTEHSNSSVLYQLNGGRWIKHNPPEPALNSEDMDEIYDLPYQYAPHPIYRGKTIPAFEQIKSSITSHRGCYGGCSFCAITCHQGKKIQSRSQASIIKEAARLRGTISDVGGPTANMYASRCKLGFPNSCRRRSCLFPQICPSLIMSHDEQLKLLAKISKLDGVKHVYIASGIRHDMLDNENQYIQEIATKYTGGRLKLAPEHVSEKVLRLMGKPSIKSYEAFCDRFRKALQNSGIKRQVIPYILIGHPGTSIEDAKLLREWLITNNIHVEQVQEFTPTPMSISTCMYYTKLDFDTGKVIEVPTPGQIREQKKMVMWK